MPVAITRMAMMPIPASGAGISLVKRGMIQMIAMVAATSASIRYNGLPDSHSPPDMPCPVSTIVPGTLNWPIWARKITIARPFTKPSITGCGTSRMNLPHCMTPAKIWISPMSTTVANRYSTPCCATKATITTAKAPVAPEIIPGRPPINAVIRPTRNAAYSPTNGFTPATKAKATASGTRARATVRPDKSSMRRREGENPSPGIHRRSVTSRFLVKLRNVVRAIGHPSGQIASISWKGRCRLLAET